MKIKIDMQCFGGTADRDEVTGSCTLLKIRRGKMETNILADIGLVQDDSSKGVEKNLKILDKLNPSSVNHIVLTHSHLDHTGRLPLMVNYGFKGKIHCTHPTALLTQIILLDSAKVQRKRANDFKKNLNRKKVFGKKGNNSNKLAPLYSYEEAVECNELINQNGHPYNEWTKLEKGIELKFYGSGHVLGGAICVIKIDRCKNDQEPLYLGFSGDLGRKDNFILPAPSEITEPINYWFIESTYGGKRHPKREDEIEKLIPLIIRANKEKRKIIIPSLAFERAQEIIFLLSLLMYQGKIPILPIFLDSPMAIEITKIFSHQWKTELFKSQDSLPFNPYDLDESPFLKIVTDRTDSLSLAFKAGPQIVIAGSGMCNAGRVRDHLLVNLGNPNTLILLTSYMAKNTLGRKLKNGVPFVTIDKQQIPVRAEIYSLESFSSHADCNSLVDYTTQIFDREDGFPDRKVFIVHGEKESGLSLKSKLHSTLNHGDWSDRIIIPKLEQSYCLF